MNAIDEFTVCRFLTSPLWDSAVWSATTFRWHPTSEAPPIMGLVFENGDAGRALFSEWVQSAKNHDELEELRVSIIEGDISGQRPGYSVHLAPDLESLSVRATAEGIVVHPGEVKLYSRVNRMHPFSNATAMLPRFKTEFAKHNEFLLAPVTRRADGQLWVDVELGIIKSVVHFRETSNITEGDIDAIVFKTPIMPAA